MNITKENTLSNLFWRYAERFGAQGINFIVSIILARLLEPEYYGTIALITVFISILNVFIDSGFANALIQKKNVDNIDFSTVFFFNIIVSLFIYILLYAVAPYIANFYDQLELVPIIRVLGLTLVISGIKNIQQAHVSRTLQFKKFFFSTLGGTLFSALVGIVMAYMGFGVWALVTQQLSNTFIDTIILWITVKWRPSFIFSFIRLKSLLSYAWKILASGLLETLYNNIYQLIIGKIYTPSDLAYFNKGQSFPSLIISNINSSIDSVLFPIMSSVQDDKERVKNLTRKSIRISSFIIWPTVVGLAACSKSIVILLLTPKWQDCIIYMQIFCIIYGFFPIHTANLNAIKAVGRSDLFLKLEIIKKIIGIVAILITLKYGVLAIALSRLITAPIFALINAFPNKTLLNYSYQEQFSDMLPPFLLSMIMGMFVYSIQFLHLSIIMTLCLQIVCGICVYLFFVKLFKLDGLEYLINIMKSVRKRKNI